MTMQELARQENLAMKRHWRAGPFDQPDIEREIMARIPENWYGPEKKPGPLYGRTGAIRCDVTNKAMRNCLCTTCAPIVRYWDR